MCMCECVFMDSSNINAFKIDNLKYKEENASFLSFLTCYYFIASFSKILIFKRIVHLSLILCYISSVNLYATYSTYSIVCLFSKT